ncbi:hypothetical protein BH11VER1_BH11VER1_14890 [soil metagenome]
MTLATAPADLVQLLHAIFGLFIFGGLTVALAGYLLRWRWTFALHWRLPHLLLTLYLAFRAYCSLPCPLSIWEDKLRISDSTLPAPVDFGHATLRLLAFRHLDASSFEKAILAFAMITVSLFLVQRCFKRSYMLGG